jgi:hypothetical protein
LRQIDSSCEPVLKRAYSRSVDSVLGVATRVIARALQYEISPRRSASSISGSSASFVATRTCSRAVP